MTSGSFQETMYPYLNNYQDLRDAESLPSYNTPSPNPTTTLSYSVETSELVSGEERSYVCTAWKSVMATKTAPLFVTIWPGTIRPETSVCCVDSLDIPLCNVGACNTRSNPLQERLTSIYPHTSLRSMLTTFKLFESGRLEV